MPSPTDRLGVTDGGRTAVLRLVDQLQPALQRNDRAAIVHIVRELVARRAPMGEQWLQLSLIAASNGEVTLARTAIDLYVEACDGSPAAAFKKAGTLMVIGSWKEALELLRTLPHDQPDPVTYARDRGTAALYLGETDEARHWLDEAVRLQPRSGVSWLLLAVLADFARDPVLADRVIANERAMEGAPVSQQAAYYYALGKVHADRGQSPQAFAAFARGADLARTQVDYNREQDRVIAAEAVRGYDAASIAALARRQSEPTARGIFVMGLPRSGTTLVEQILTSHSAVSDGGEIYRLALLVKDIGGLSCRKVSEFVERAGAPAAAQLWRHWLDERFPRPGRVVDKTLHTGRLLGLAAALLPEAPLIWLKREPLDCAWSCFRTRFHNEAPWSYDLEDIAFHFRLEDELQARWQDILGDRLLIVPYEALATEPEPWIRRILTHCDLPEEPQVFAPHETPRAVTTSSTMQVRRPINRQGVGAAEPYRHFLQPFVEAYYD